MNITIVGAGNVGGTLAIAFNRAGHSIIFGVRDTDLSFKGKELAIQYRFPYFKVPEAVAKSEVIVICTPAQFAGEVAKTLGDVANKMIIDTMNMASATATSFNNTADVILNNCNCKDVVKCFNSTGFENMANPVYQEDGIDMFVAGNSSNAKKIAMQLAIDIGFEKCYDFGGNDKFFALEQLAFAWINLAIVQKNGRNLAFKILKR